MAIAERYGHVVWSVKGIRHQRKARTVGEQLRTLPGVLEADANAAGLVRIEFDLEQITERQLQRALAGMGVTHKRRSLVLPAEDAYAGHDHGSEDDGKDKRQIPAMIMANFLAPTLN